MLLCTSDGAAQEDRPALAAVSAGHPHPWPDKLGRDCLLGWGPSLAVLRMVLVPAHTIFSPLPWNKFFPILFFRGTEEKFPLLFFRSSVPAVPPTLLHYLVMARWSLSVFALTVTCSMSLLSIVTELVSDKLNYCCVFWSLTWTDIFDLSQELTWKRDPVRAT